MRGFTLLELLLAMVIFATALVSLGAAVSSGIGAAGDSINERAAREACRTLLEAAVANGDQSGGGPVPGHDGMQWNLTREEHTAGAADNPEEKYDILTVTVTFPTENGPAPSAGSSFGASATNGQVKLSTIVDPPDLDKTGSAPAPGTPK